MNYADNTSIPGRKLLFFDIDGTLVSFKTHRIPASAIKSITAAHNAGHKIIISTGRPKAIINNLGDIEHLIDGYITMNGAYCFADGSTLYKSAIPQRDIDVISRKAAEYGVPCIFVNEHRFSIAGANTTSHDVFGTQLNVPYIEETDYITPTLLPIYQITPFFDSTMQHEVRPLTSGSEYGCWHPAFVDITAKGNTKAHGIDIFVDYYGVSLADTVAFGDGGNDIPMLQHASIGVAMGNADDEVKQCADMVTTAIDDDGIANAFIKLNLI